MNGRVVLGLSGGVDSAVSAALLQREGWAVTGCYLDNGLPGWEGAQRAAEELKIPLLRRDIRRELEERVCAPFARSYLRGETPSPCVLCNREVKFPALLSAAEELGAEKIATGHYARVRAGRIAMGCEENDQSYMLCRLDGGAVSRLLLPLGDLPKSRVRQLARDMGLSVADKADSMDICFIPDGDYAAYIESRGVTPPPGDFLFHGEVVGQHRGIHHYTPGQRKRLGIALGKRVYVSAIDPGENTVTLSDDEEVWRRSIRVRDSVWNGSFELPHPFAVRVRHTHHQSPDTLPTAVLHPDGTLLFDAPIRAPAPGQAAAFYEGDAVVGGGFIA